MDLPGLSVIIGGLWVSNLYYWGCNQYIIQRALAAKSIGEAQKEMAFAAYIKLLVPFCCHSGYCSSCHGRSAVEAR